MAAPGTLTHVIEVAAALAAADAAHGASVGEMAAAASVVQPATQSPPRPA